MKKHYLRRVKTRQQNSNYNKNNKTSFQTQKDNKYFLSVFSSCRVSNLILSPLNVLFSFCRHLVLWYLKWHFVLLLFCPGEERQNEKAQIGHNWSEKISVLKIWQPLEFIPYTYDTRASNILRSFLVWVYGIVSALYL